MESTYSAAMDGLSKYIKHGQDRLTRLMQEYTTGKAKYSVQKEADLIKQKYMIQESAAHNTKNQIKSSIEYEKIEELKWKPIHGQSNQELERPSVHKEKSMAWVCSSGQMGEAESNNSSPRSSTQHTLSKEEHHEATI
jgi:hypothetical protein